MNGILPSNILFMAGLSYQSFIFFFSSRRRHTRYWRDWSSDVCSSDLTVPILAIAPMVVVWLKAGWISVAVIAAYLTFFPVTINTLRGLDSADPRALELMRSYAASRWAILWKLRVPASLPYLFAAFKDRKSVV